MVRQNGWVILLLGLCLQMPAIARQGTTAQAAKSGGESQKKDPFAGFRWLDASGDTQGALSGGRQLSSLSAGIRDRSQSDVEIEVTRPGADSMRTTRRVYDRNTHGERVLVEVVVEDVRTTGADTFSATRTQSQRDVNGNLQVATKQVQESAPAGPGSYRTRITTMGPGVRGTLTPVSDVVQLENRKPDGVVEIDRTQQVPGSNGGWIPADRHLSSTRVENGQSVTVEDIYKRDAEGKLVLSQKEVSRERTDPQGRTFQEREVSSPNSAGRFEVTERLTIRRETYADGSRQTTQDRFRKSAAYPSEGMKLMDTIVETDTPSGSNAADRLTVVKVPDVNGRLQTVATQTVVQK